MPLACAPRRFRSHCQLVCQAHRYRRVRPGRLHFRGLVLHTEKHRDGDIRNEFGSGEQDISVLRSQQHYRVSQGNIPYIPIAITLKLKRFYHVAWVRQESGFNAIYLNSIEIGVAGLPTGALDIDDGGLWLGQTQSAVGRFSPGANCLCRLDETALHDDDLGQKEINRRYFLTRRLKELEREGLQTNMASTKLDDKGALVNARLDALEVQFAANQNALLGRFQNIDDSWTT